MKRSPYLLSWRAARAVSVIRWTFLDRFEREGLGLRAGLVVVVRALAIGLPPQSQSHSVQGGERTWAGVELLS